MDLIEQWLATGNRILIAPGWNNSGDEHWQTLWQQQYPQFERIEQDDWQQPHAGYWVRKFEQKIAEREVPTIIVAHSLACATLAHWSALYGRERCVQGALLVAPADVMRPEAPDAFRGFAPLPHIPLSFLSWVVASGNDHSCTEERASQLAATWRSKLTVLPDAGHINVESGHGDWPDGLDFLRRLITLIQNIDE